MPHNIIYLVPLNKFGLCCQNVSFISMCSAVNVRRFLVLMECCDWSVSVEFSSASHTLVDASSEVFRHVSLSICKLNASVYTTELNNDNTVLGLKQLIQF